MIWLVKRLLVRRRSGIFHMQTGQLASISAPCYRCLPELLKWGQRSSFLQHDWSHPIAPRVRRYRLSWIKMVNCGCSRQLWLDELDGVLWQCIVSTASGLLSSEFEKESLWFLKSCEWLFFSIMRPPQEISRTFGNLGKSHGARVDTREMLLKPSLSNDFPYSAVGCLEK